MPEKKARTSRCRQIGFQKLPEMQQVTLKVLRCLLTRGYHPTGLTKLCVKRSLTP